MRAVAPRHECAAHEMNGDNDPGQTVELFASAARAEKEVAFARVEPVVLNVTDVVPTVNEQAESKGDERNAEPEIKRAQHRTLCEWQQVKPNRGEPEAGARCFE